MSETTTVREQVGERTPLDPPPVSTGARAVASRLVEPMPADGWRGWAGPLVVTLLAAIVRFAHLGRPDKFVFDETYYAKDAFSLLNHGYARAFQSGADGRIIGGDLDVFADGPSFVVHPDVGKWMIALGEWAFGMNPFGWRFSVALFGTLTVLMLARIARRLMRSTMLGTTAGLLLALDGLHVVESRTAILDALLAFWILAAFGCLLIDRDRMRARYAAWAIDREARGRLVRTGPALGWRPWRLAAGVCLGLAAGVKWSGLFVLVVFGLMTVLWDVRARRMLGVRRPWGHTLALDAPAAFVTVAGTAVVTYVATWAGWIATGGGWSRQWAADRPASGLAGLMPDWARSLWHYHGEMYRFHTNLSTSHSYASDPWGWLILKRPVSFDYAGIDAGQQGCDADRCAQAVLAIGTPALWWGACAALVVCLWLWLGRRDWRAGAILAGVAATYLPWFLYLDRTIFYFYAVTTVPFLVLAVTLVLGYVVGPSAEPRRRAVGTALAGSYVLLVVVSFAYLYPILVDQVIPYDAWHDRMWFRTWI